MPRPNNKAAISAYVQGLREAKAAFQALPEAMREDLNDATIVTAKEIVRIAQGKLRSSPSIQTRNLHDAVGYTMNKKSGLAKVGVMNVTTTIVVGGKKIRVKGKVTAGRGGSALRSQGAKLDKPRRRAHFVEFGTRHMKAEPFMTPAVEIEKDAYLRRCIGAGKRIEQKAPSLGGRLL